MTGSVVEIPPPRRSRLMLVLETALHTILMPAALLAGFPALILGRGGILPWQFSSVRLAAIVPIGAGIIIGSYCTRDFIEIGQGTPNPLDPPRFLVAGRFYRLVRNPMYVGVELILLGEAQAFASIGLLIYAAGVWLLCHLVVVLYEEPALRRTFGTSYDAYCRAVPRWVPRLAAIARPWKAGA